MTTSAVAPPVFHRRLLALALIAACGTVAAQVIVTPPAPREPYAVAGGQVSVAGRDLLPQGEQALLLEEQIGLGR